MDNPVLSIIVLGPRHFNWVGLYMSILESTKKNFEVIFCGPGPLPIKLYGEERVKFVKEFGSPVRAASIAASIAEGDLITWVTDDGLFLPETLDLIIDEFLTKRKNRKKVIVWQSSRLEKDFPLELFKMGYHRSDSGFSLCCGQISEDFYLFNNAMMHRVFFEELGGLDCVFESCLIALSDLAIRTQQSKAKVDFFSWIPIFILGPAADKYHKVCEESMISDFMQYNKRYKEGDAWKKNLCIEKDNWKNAPKFWSRAFNLGEIDPNYGKA